MSVADTCTGSQDEFAVGTVRGIRTWDLVPNGTLQSLSRFYNWVDGENTAECVFAKLHNERNAHSGFPGDPTCTCGFYAYYDGSVFRLGDVLGIIDGYGHVTVGTKGFRCEKAKIVAICLERPRLLTLRTAVVMLVLAVNFLVVGWNTVTNMHDIVSWMFTVLFSALFGATTYLSFMDFKRARIDRKTFAVKEELIRFRYPSAEYFTSHRAMLKKYEPNSGGLTNVKFRRFRYHIYRSVRQ